MKFQKVVKSIKWTAAAIARDKVELKATAFPMTMMMNRKKIETNN